MLLGGKGGGVRAGGGDDAAVGEDGVRARTTFVTRGIMAKIELSGMSSTEIPALVRERASA